MKFLKFFAIGLLSASTAASAESLTNSDTQIRFVSCCQGYTEALARVIANELKEKVRQQIMVETRPGANGILAADHVAKAPPDGYTVLFGTNSTHAANQILYDNLPYDYVKDFTPISGLSEGTLVLGVDARLPIHNVSELTRFARENPGKLNSGGASSSTQAGAELYKMLTGVDIAYIPYKTNPQAVVDLIGGRIEMTFNDANTLMPHIKSGTIRPLAVSTSQRSEALPDVPTMQEAGVPGYALSFWHGVWAPAGLDPEKAKELTELIQWALQQPRVVQHIKNAGARVMPLGPQELLEFSQEEEKKWRDIVVKSKMKIN